MYISNLHIDAARHALEGLINQRRFLEKTCSAICLRQYDELIESVAAAYCSASYKIRDDEKQERNGVDERTLQEKAAF